MAEASLLKAARALDQDGPETVASKLTRFWTALEATAPAAGSDDGGRFYAAEAIALRWLLKNMAGGSTPEAETLRRWPMTWRILACILHRIPLFSLAKALADRRFIAVLQQTARDLATPTPTPTPAAAASSSPAAPGSRKRKRAHGSDDTSLHYDDLATLRTPHHCLVSAAALFAALRALLGRLDREAAVPDADQGGRPAALAYEHMGAEHIKTLFSMPAADAMALLVPLLRIGNLALTAGVADAAASGAEDADDTEDTLAAEEASSSAPPPLEGQADWLSVFAALWDLHAQGPTDAVEVTTHLAPFGFAMLGRLQAASIAGETATTETQRRWTAALRRFLTNNVVLPARAAFLNRNDSQILAIAVGDPAAGGSSSSSIDAAVLRSSVLLGLALRAPTPLLAAAASRDNALWLRILLDKILEPFLAAEAAAAGLDPRRRNAALASLLELAAQHGVAPSAKTLRWIAGHAALGETAGRPRKGKKGRRGGRGGGGSGGGGGEEETAVSADGADHTTAQDAAVDWRLMAAVARCDADVFLVPPKTQGAGSDDRDDHLLDTVLDRVLPASAGEATAAADHEHAAQFLVALARAFAKARNLSGFVLRWYRSLVAAADAEEAAVSAALNPWLHPGVRSAVADALQPSLTKEQLLTLLDQILQETADASNGAGAETNGAAGQPEHGRRGAVVVARLVVLDALSAGVSLEEYEDAVQTKMVDAVVGGSDGLAPVPAAAAAMRWRLVRRTLSWVGADDAERLWTAVCAALADDGGEEQEGDDIKEAAKKKKKSSKAKKQHKTAPAPAPSPWSYAEGREAAFEAFVCSFSFWMALKLSGPAEHDARATTWRLFDRFSAELATLSGASAEGADGADGALLLRQEVARRLAAYRDGASPADTTAAASLFATRAAAAATYLAWMLCGSSRFVDEMVKSSSSSDGSGGTPSRFLDALVAWQTAAPAAASDAVSAALLANATSLQNSTVTDTVAARYVQQLQAHDGPAAARPRDALLGLLRMPSHLLVRPLRETIVSLLLPPVPSSAAAEPATASLEDTVLVLDLLTRVLLRDRAASGSVDLARLRPLAEAVHAAVGAAPLATAVGVLDRLQRLATLVACRAAATGSGGADRDDWILSSSSSATPVELQFVFLRALVASAKTTAAAGGGNDAKAQDRLASLVVKQLRRHLEREEADNATEEDVAMTGTADAPPAAGRPQQAMPPVPVLLALETALADDGQAVEAALRQQKKFASVVDKAGAVADRLCRQNEPVGWKWKAFYVRYAAVAPPHEVVFGGLFATPQQPPPTPLPLFATPASVLLDSDLLRAYLAAATRNSSPAALLAYVQDLIDAAFPLQRPQEQQQEEHATPRSSVAPLLAIQYLLDRFLAAPQATATPPADGAARAKGAFSGLAFIHSRLVQRLPRAQSAVECRLLTQTLRTLLLDDKVAAAAMGQWNVDVTLSSVAVLVGGDGRAGSAGPVYAAPGTFDDACSLVEAILKRHRVRLEGRFHLLVRTLQALLRRLVAGHQEALRQRGGGGGAKRKRLAGAGDGAPAPPPADWTGQAKRFSRLLELVCEPSTAAVTRMAPGGGGSNGAAAGPGAPLLHSATDTAKRSAGQHMYLVLMTYIKLQIDGAVVVRSVREALEPGLFSVLTITSDETRRLLNDAVDASGRALFRDLYRRWLQFGKWKGV